MEQHLETPTPLAFAPPAAQQRLCRIECQGCGASAEVALEAFVPANLQLRCLGCGDDHVRVTSLSATEIANH